MIAIKQNTQKLTSSLNLDALEGILANQRRILEDNWVRSDRLISQLKDDILNGVLKLFKDNPDVLEYHSATMYCDQCIMDITNAYFDCIEIRKGQLWKLLWSSVEDIEDTIDIYYQIAEKSKEHLNFTVEHYIEYVEILEAADYKDIGIGQHFKLFTRVHSLHMYLTRQIKSDVRLLKLCLFVRRGFKK